jgi:hypothetical protein
LDENQIHAALNEVIDPLGMFDAKFVIGRDKIGTVAVFER